MTMIMNSIPAIMRPFSKDEIRRMSTNTLGVHATTDMGESVDYVVVDFLYGDTTHAGVAIDFGFALGIIEKEKPLVQYIGFDGDGRSYLHIRVCFKNKPVPVHGTLTADKCKKQSCENQDFFGEKCQNTFWKPKESNQKICGSCRNEEAEKYLDI